MCVCVYVADPYPSGYEIPNNWYDYINAVRRTLEGGSTATGPLGTSTLRTNREAAAAADKHRTSTISKHDGKISKASKASRSSVISGDNNNNNNNNSKFNSLNTNNYNNSHSNSEKDANSEPSLFPVDATTVSDIISDAASKISSSTTGKTTTVAPPTAADFGILGTPGFSTGAFLRSPFADNSISDPSVPDIQITLFPNVS